MLEALGSRLSRLSVGRTALLVAALCAGCHEERPTEPSTPSTVKSCRGIWMLLRAEKLRFSPDEPVALTARFENRSARDVELPPFDPWLGGWRELEGSFPRRMDQYQGNSSFTLIRVEPWPKGLEPGDPIGKCPVPLPIPAGGSLDVSFNLEEVIGGADLPPGRYRITVEYGATEDRSRQGLEPLYWSLLSNTLHLVIED